jgi:hypothetical protein
MTQLLSSVGPASLGGGGGGERVPTLVSSPRRPCTTVAGPRRSTAALAHGQYVRTPLPACNAHGPPASRTLAHEMPRLPETAVRSRSGDRGFAPPSSVAAARTDVFVRVHRPHGGQRREHLKVREGLDVVLPSALDGRHDCRSARGPRDGLLGASGRAGESVVRISGARPPARHAERIDWGMVPRGKSVGGRASSKKWAFAEKRVFAHFPASLFFV